MTTTGDTVTGGEVMDDVVRYRTDEEIFALDKELYSTGIPYEVLDTGDCYKYEGGKSGEKYEVSVLQMGIETVYRPPSQPWRGWLAPLVMVARFDKRGELIDSTAGLLIGTSPGGGDDGFHQVLPKEGSEFVTLVLEKLQPQDTDEPDLEHIIVRDELVRERKSLASVN